MTWEAINNREENKITPIKHSLLILLIRPTPKRLWMKEAHLVAGDAVVGVGGGGVVCGAVQRLLGLRGATDVAAVETASMLQHRGVKTQLMEVIGGGHLVPGIRRLVVGVEPRHVGLWGSRGGAQKYLLHLSWTNLKGLDGPKLCGVSPFCT